MQTTGAWRDVLGRRASTGSTHREERAVASRRSGVAPGGDTQGPGTHSRDDKHGRAYGSATHTGGMEKPASSGAGPPPTLPPCQEFC